MQRRHLIKDLYIGVMAVFFSLVLFGFNAYVIINTFDFIISGYFDLHKIRAGDRAWSRHSRVRQTSRQYAGLIKSMKSNRALGAHFNCGILIIFNVARHV